MRLARREAKQNADDTYEVVNQPMCFNCVSCTNYRMQMWVCEFRAKKVEPNGTCEEHGKHEPASH